MSKYRSEYKSKFSSKGAFDALPVDDVPSDDEGEESAIVEPAEPTYVSHRDLVANGSTFFLHSVLYQSRESH